MKRYWECWDCGAEKAEDCYDFCTCQMCEDEGIAAQVEADEQLRKERIERGIPPSDLW
jgi:hypothetical protein